MKYAEGEFPSEPSDFPVEMGLMTEWENKLVLDTIDICDLRHWGRVDFMMNNQGDFLIIDVNTVPGMTSHSLVPMAAKEAGLNFQQLVLKILELTLIEEVVNV